MRIDIANRSYISDVAYVHDAYFNGFTHDYKNRQIEFQCKSFDGTFWFVFRFNNVFGFRMNSCDWWGESNRILDWELVENGEDSLTQELVTFRSDEQTTNSRLINPELAIESKFTFVSGDILEVSCENIDFVEKKI